VIELRAGSATDVGLVRSNNQDELLVAAPLFAVADGMGGAAAGEVASHTAIQALRRAFEDAGEATSDALMVAAQAANRAVWDQAEANPEMRGMGTTLVALAGVAGDRLAVINVGDSRLYTLHSDEFEQVTADHNLVAELVAEGRLSKEEAEFHPRRNILTRALGVDPEVTIDLLVVDAVPGDRFLLCSDGLPREVRDDQIASVLRRLSDPQEAAKELVGEAKLRGGNDNITVVVVDVVDKEKGPDPDADDATRAAGDATVATSTQDGGEASPGRRRRRAGRTDRTRRTVRPVTPRVIVFVVALLLLVAAAVAGTAWYARAGYFVGLQGDRVTIFQGRPGGLLWWQPTVAAATAVTTGDVLARHLPQLAAGQTEPSLSAAQQYIDSLVAEQQAAAAAARPPAPSTTTTTTRKAAR
jgi:protein phosphatase